MEKLINSQIETLQTELAEIQDPYQRAHIRVLFLTALGNLSAVGEVSEVAVPTGKEAIKNDTVKEQPAKEEKKSTKKSSKKKEEVKEDKPLEFEPDRNETAAEPTEIDIDKDPSLEQNEEVTGPIIIETEEGDLDITEAYLALDKLPEGDEKTSIAMNITAYSLLPIYQSLENLTDCENKMLLAYYMKEYGLEEINGFISSLTDEKFDDIYKFANDDNLEGIIVNLQSAEADAEE